MTILPIIIVMRVECKLQEGQVKLKLEYTLRLNGANPSYVSFYDFHHRQHNYDFVSITFVVYWGTHLTCHHMIFIVVIITFVAYRVLQGERTMHWFLL